MPITRSPCAGKLWSLQDSYSFIATYLRHNQPIAYPSKGSLRGAHIIAARSHGTITHPGRSGYPREFQRSFIRQRVDRNGRSRRHFHDYFVTHLPSSSLHPDSRSAPGHKLPRAASTPHTGKTGTTPASVSHTVGASRELTVVRIPLRSAKHHFGVSVSRGQRPYNEDAYQAGILEIPAFAKKAPISLSRKGPGATVSSTNAESAGGDPQIFYFGVFDGHGGHECSDFLRQELHTYLEETANTFGLGSSLRKDKTANDSPEVGSMERGASEELGDKGQQILKMVKVVGEDDVEPNVPVKDESGRLEQPPASPALEGEEPVSMTSNKPETFKLQKLLVSQWKETVGGYFRRFKPEYFSLSGEDSQTPISIESVIMYAFLKADLEFVTAQARKPSDHAGDQPLNADEVLGKPSIINPNHQIGGTKRFQGGSTASVAMISTPTPTPFWHPSAPSTLLIAHVGDTRILLCETTTGLAKPLTTNHHPSSPVEGNRLRRYAATFVTDSFGEERMSGLANTRAFGDMRSKRIGVSAEPEVRRIELAPAEYSFMVLISDGVSGTLTDQEIVDIVKEAKTPEQGARDVVSFATEVTKDGDNATCLVVRLGGWERRIEGGMGSMGTKEVRDFRKGDALDPRSRRT